MSGLLHDQRFLRPDVFEILLSIHFSQSDIIRLWVDHSTTGTLTVICTLSLFYGRWTWTALYSLFITQTKLLLILHCSTNTLISITTSMSELVSNICFTTLPHFSASFFFCSMLICRSLAKNTLCCVSVSVCKTPKLLQ